ncbi:protein kinase [Streptomyces sp. NBC_00083]|uniref:protein kinase n=1 Tax=Streptomyces sp. NBC_00083 TaxID=2975647 RepID=UPI0022590F99|nr:protein kinase [Streptomyces sp. NBC_00083]MCX5385119.1 protein kinase [Streptomyces sp. NBC_00083]
MDDYAGRVLADRYRLPLPLDDSYDLVETRAFDTYSGQQVLVRQIPLPEVVDAEVLEGDDAYGTPDAYMRGGGDVGEYGGGASGNGAAYGDTGAYGSTGAYGGGPGSESGYGGAPGYGRTTRRPADPAVRRAVEAAQAAAQIPDHPRLDQVFDVFAQDGSLWIVSELIAARPLSALLADRPMNPFRAAEVASDVLTALRVLHAHGWTHRNITARTVLICDDGRVVLTGLAVGAAQEALCGYAPVPLAADDDGFGGAPRPVDAPEANEAVPQGTSALEPAPGATPESAARPAPPGAAGRAGVIAAYRAGARAAARAGADAVLPDQRPAGPEPDPNDRPLLPGQGDPGRSDEGATGAGPGMYDPVRGVRVPSGGASPYADDEGPDSGRTRRQYDPVTGRWVPRPAGRPAGAPNSDAERPYQDPDGDPHASEAARPHNGADASVNATGSTGSARSARAEGFEPPRAPAPRTPALPPGFRADAFRADSQRVPHPGPPASAPASQRTAAPQPRSTPDRHPAPDAPYRGPANRLAAERARHTRMAVVGAVTERWAPEQAGPIHENWRLAPPIGPATDLWALGALLFRAVQGHAPYPEESAADLVQMVCGEPPAFAEECGPLRPVVESLLRQDPTERPEFEELRGWLRSLVRSAPEPEAGTRIAPVIVPDDKKLPIVRRRGELVRRRRKSAAASAAAPVAAPAEHGRHRHRQAAPPSGKPRSLGRLLLVLVLLLLAGAIAYAVLFMPRSGSGQDTGSAPPAGSAGQQSPGTSGQSPPAPTPSGTPPSQQTQTTGPGGTSSPPAAGYVVRKDPEGFQVGVDSGWQRQPMNDAGQVRYVGGDFTLIVVPGRDTVRADGSDPLAYQADKERELQPFRDSSWSTSTGLRRIDVGQQSMAEGQFTWRDSSGRQVYVRNLALIVNGRYHVVQVIGPESQRDKVTEIFGQATGAYRATR